QPNRLAQILRRMDETGDETWENEHKHGYALRNVNNPAFEEEDYTTSITFQIPVSAKGEGYPAEGSFIKVKYAKLELVEDSFWGSYMYVVVPDYTA
ncbi:MAG: hypothetical protein J6J01_09125, partial [Oscillospiraceae bacterium]|nr:hypothetical protein [Oscillospiraceae bacterium]